MQGNGKESGFVTLLTFRNFKQKLGTLSLVTNKHGKAHLDEKGTAISLSVIYSTSASKSYRFSGETRKMLTDRLCITHVNIVLNPISVGGHVTKQPWIFQNKLFKFHSMCFWQRAKVNFSADWTTRTGWRTASSVHSKPPPTYQPPRQESLLLIPVGQHRRH